MSFAFPYFGFPSLRRYNNNKHSNNMSNIQKEEVKKDSLNKKIPENNKDTNPDSGIINLFGINLNSDDILIIGLLFLLYTEGVKDQGLFISLIMLLLDR